MSPKSTNLSGKRQESLKQGTLSFATVKRAASGNVTSKSKSSKPTKPAPVPKSSNSVDNTSVDDDSDDVELYLSESEDEDKDEIQNSSDVAEDHKKPTLSGTRAQTKATYKLTTVKEPAQEQKAIASATANLGTIPLKASKARPDDVSKISQVADEKPELDVKDRKWNKHYAEVRKKMGHLPPGEFIG